MGQQIAFAGIAIVLCTPVGFRPLLRFDGDYGIGLEGLLRVVLSHSPTAEFRQTRHCERGQESPRTGGSNALVRPASRLETRYALRCLVRTNDWMNFKFNQVDPVSHPLIEKRSIGSFHD